jgi:hypothetical protein
MSSPNIKTIKKNEQNINFNFLKTPIYIYYPIIVFFLLVILKPKIIMKKNNLKKDSEISIIKVLLWELLFCLPLIFYIIIN